MGCNGRNRPVPDNTATETQSFIYLCLGGEKWSHGRVHEQRNPRRRRLTMDPGPRTPAPPQNRRHTPASVRVPAFHSPGAASLSVGRSSLRGKQNLTREVSIHTNSRLTAMVVSKLISRFDAERRAHLLLIRLDRFFTSAPSVHTFPPFRRRSASD